MNIEVLAALQTAKGTEKTDTMAKLSATDYGVLPSVDKKVSEALGSGRWVRDGFVSKISVAGDVPVELTMDQLEILLAGTDYVMTSGASIDKYLTIGVNDLDSNMFEYSKDCQVSSLAVNVQLEAFIKGTANIIGMDHVTKNTKFSGTATAVRNESLICLGSKITEKTNDITSQIESLDLTIDNKLEGKGALNSVYYKSIKQSDRGTVTLGLTFNEFNKASYMDAQDLLLANGEFKVETEFAELQDPNKKVVFEFPKCKISKNERTDLAGAGGMSKELEAFYDETIKSPVKITFKNYTNVL
ncbi:MAG: hypothetical protein LBV03_06355 [Fusobacteriales bacterium]|jgi:hypothetical protein|nr:hypothetical protein [Fusobacteriales bacterium]